MEFEFSKTFLLNSEKPKADSLYRESSKAEFWRIVLWKARITSLSLILRILKTRKNDEFVILAFHEMVFENSAFDDSRFGESTFGFLEFSKKVFENSNFIN